MSAKDGVIELILGMQRTIEAIPDADFSRPLDIYNGSSIGEHFRHIYDFFHCLVDQCESCEMDYALRRRDQRISSDRQYCMEAFEHLSQHIGSIDSAAPTSVTADFEVEGQRPIAQSTVGRELMYAYDHAVHHLAIVKIGIRAVSPEIAIDDDLGVAASTLRHRQG